MVRPRGRMLLGQGVLYCRFRVGLYVDRQLYGEGRALTGSFGRRQCACQCRSLCAGTHPRSFAGKLCSATASSAVICRCRTPKKKYRWYVHSEEYIVSTENGNDDEPNKTTLLLSHKKLKVFIRGKRNSYYRQTNTHE